MARKSRYSNYMKGLQEIAKYRKKSAVNESVFT